MIKIKVSYTDPKELEYVRRNGLGTLELLGRTRKPRQQDGIKRLYLEIDKPLNKG